MQYGCITYHDRYNHVNKQHLFKNDTGNRSKRSKYTHHYVHDYAGDNSTIANSCELPANEFKVC
jgi:hypothetical protein